MSSERVKGAGANVPRDRSQADGLTHEQVAELEQRTDLGCRLLFDQAPTEDLHEALLELIEELDAYVGECRAASRA